MSEHDALPDAVEAERLRMVRAEQVAAFDQSVRPALVFHVVAAAIMMVTLWDLISPLAMVTWFVSLFLSNLLRLVMSQIYRGRADRDLDPERWAQIFTIGRFVSGAAWGSAAFVLYIPDSFASHAVVTMVLFALAAASVTATAPYQMTNFAFVLPTISPLMVRMLVEGNTLNIALSALVSLFLLFILLSGRSYQRILMESLKIRYENIGLIEELKEQKAAAEAADSAKTRFLAAASHDLRQPLFAIGMDAVTLRSQLAGTEALPVAARISGSVDALQSMFNEILDISRLDAGMVSPRRVNFGLHNLLSRLAMDYTPQAADKGVELRVRNCRAAVHSDPTLLERILRNFVANAVRYTPRGGILIACRPRSDGVRIEVWDTGVGISEVEREHIFEEFYQVGNPERDRTRGLGLGLAIVHRLASLLDYPVEVRSEPGRGSMFAVTVPRATEPLPAPAPAPTDAAQRDRLHGSFIVFIDDERDVRESMQALFAGWGCELRTAASAAELLQAMGEHARAPDLIIADYRLRGGETGTEAVRQVQTRFEMNIPALLVTGDTAPDRLREAQAGGIPLLHKPVAPVRLRQAVNELLAESDPLALLPENQR